MVSSIINNKIVLYGTITGITTPGQSEVGSNGNERVLHISDDTKMFIIYQHILNLQKKKC